MRDAEGSRLCGGEIECAASSVYLRRGRDKLIRLEGVCSWTLKSRQGVRGAQPDVCHTIGRVVRERRRSQDDAIEVIRPVV